MPPAQKHCIAFCIRMKLFIRFITRLCTVLKTYFSTKLELSLWFFLGRQNLCRLICNKYANVKMDVCTNERLPFSTRSSCSLNLYLTAATHLYLQCTAFPASAIWLSDILTKFWNIFSIDIKFEVSVPKN